MDFEALFSSICEEKVWILSQDEFIWTRVTRLLQAM